MSRQGVVSRLGCGASVWLLNFYIDGAVGEVRVSLKFGKLDTFRKMVRFSHMLYVRL